MSREPLHQEPSRRVVSGNHSILTHFTKGGPHTEDVRIWVNTVFLLNFPQDRNCEICRGPKLQGLFAEHGYKYTILWNFAGLARNYAGIIVRQHHTDQKQMGLQKERCAG